MNGIVAVLPRYRRHRRQGCASSVAPFECVVCQRSFFWSVQLPLPRLCEVCASSGRWSSTAEVSSGSVRSVSSGGPSSARLARELRGCACVSVPSSNAVRCCRPIVAVVVCSLLSSASSSAAVCACATLRLSSRFRRYSMNAASTGESSVPAAQFRHAVIGV